MIELIFASLLVSLPDNYSDTCSLDLREKAPNQDIESAATRYASQAQQKDGLAVQVFDDHTLLVVTTGSNMPDLTINGHAATFTWIESSDASFVALEQCSLAKSALSLSAGSMHVEWVGPGFFDARPDVEDTADSLRTISLYSDALEQEREIYLIIGEGWSGAEGDPLLISGDGLAAGAFGAIVEALANQGQIRPMAFASARFGEGMLGSDGAHLRNVEYDPPGESASELRIAAYKAHEEFFFDEFLPYVIDELGGEVGPIYTFGISASATFALEQGLKRSDTVSGIISASPPIHRQTRALAEKASDAQVIRLWCGKLESFFCDPISKFSEEHSYQLHIRHASHLSAFWEEALSASLLELFPRNTE